MAKSVTKELVQDQGNYTVLWAVGAGLVCPRDITFGFLALVRKICTQYMKLSKWKVSTSREIVNKRSDNMGWLFCRFRNGVCKFGAITLLPSSILDHFVIWPCADSKRTQSENWVKLNELAVGFIFRNSIVGEEGCIHYAKAGCNNPTIIAADFWQAHRPLIRSIVVSSKTAYNTASRLRRSQDSAELKTSSRGSECRDSSLKKTLPSARPSPPLAHIS